MSHKFLTLGIESSCDETACAVLQGKDKLCSNIISSSLALHGPFGGVVPEIASRHTLESIDHVLARSLSRARCSLKDINLIAVTHGPGLIGPLLVGVHFAKTLSYALRLPIVGVNHLEAHLEVNFLNCVRYPSSFIGFVVSGGHTVLVLFRNEKYRYLGETVDDAAGEAFDKVAKILELGFPGGPLIDKLAVTGDPLKIPFPVSKTKGPFDFSFSGIKTAVLYYVRRNPKWKREIHDIAASFQRSVVTSLVEKSILACERNKVGTLVLGGGVTANSALRKTLRAEAGKRGIEVLFPELIHTMDNAAMTAYSGYARFRKHGGASGNIIADPSLSIGEKGG